MPSRVRVLVLEDVRALVDVPAVVLEPGALGRGVIDLLPLALADVADPEIPRLAVEREAPGVAEAVAVHPPATRAMWIDGEELAELLFEVLRPVLGIAARAAVSHADVESAVWPERELATVVVRVRLVDEEELAALHRR